MKLKRVEYKQGKEGANPHSITVEMSIKEALWIQKVIENSRINDRVEDIGDCLRCDIFNLYWEDGKEGAEREIGNIPTPPIIYS